MEENKTAEKKNKPLLYILIIGVLGAVFLLLSSFGEGESAAANAGAEEIPDPEAFAAELEGKIESLCSQLDGAGRVTAVVTLKGGYKKVYAYNSQPVSGGGYKTEIVMRGNGSGERAVEVCYENPEIAGIGIVCDGGGDESVRAAMIELVSATFDVKTNRISVAGTQK